MSNANEVETQVKDQQRKVWIRLICWNGFLILSWYFLSSFLTLFNKLFVGEKEGIMNHEPFPAPIFMTSLQFVIQHILARVILFTKLVPRVGQQRKGWRDFFIKVVPNGASTGLDISFSNKALVYITTSFYTMLKSTSPMFLLLFAFIWGIEEITWQLFGIVLTICTGLILLTTGETDFQLLGFLLTLAASCLSGLRWTITQILLQKRSKEAVYGGPLEVLESVTPVMALVTFVTSIFWELIHNDIGNTPYFNTATNTLLTMLIVTMIATVGFLMVWVEFCVIQNTSALTLMIAGQFKEVVTIVASIIVFHDKFSPPKIVGLVVVMLGIALFNVLKYYETANKLAQGKEQVSNNVPVEIQMQRSYLAHQSSLVKDKSWGRKDSQILLADLDESEQQHNGDLKIHVKSDTGNSSLYKQNSKGDEYYYKGNEQDLENKSLLERTLSSPSKRFVRRQSQN